MTTPNEPYEAALKAACDVAADYSVPGARGYEQMSPDETAVILGDSGEIARAVLDAVWSLAVAEGRRQAAGAIRAAVIVGASPPQWAQAGVVPRAADLREWAATIAEGTGEADEPDATAGRCYIERRVRGDSRALQESMPCVLPPGHEGEDHIHPNGTRWRFGKNSGTYAVDVKHPEAKP